MNDNWVILFVRGGKEEKLRRMLGDRLGTGEYHPFFPTKEILRRLAGGIFRKKRAPLFPGYLFIRTAIDPEAIGKNLRTALMDDGVWPEDVVKLLHYGNNKNDVAVRKRERLFWESMFDADFCITGSEGVIEGDKIKITSGPLFGREGWIKWVDRHKRKAVIESEMMGGVHRATVMLRVVGKVSSK